MNEKILSLGNLERYNGAIQGQIEDMETHMESVVSEMFEPVRLEFEESLASYGSEIQESVGTEIDEYFENYGSSLTAMNDEIESLSQDLGELDSVLSGQIVYVDEYFGSVESSVGAVWDNFQYVASSIEANAVGLAANWEKIQELEGWKPSVESSIGNLNTRATNIQASLGNANTSIGNLSKYDSSLQASIGNANTSIGTLNTKATNIQTSLGNTNTSLSNANTSIGTLNTKATNIQTSLGNTNTSLNNVTTRVSNLESKHNPFTLGTSSSTVNGAIWYVA